MRILVTLSFITLVTAVRIVPMNLRKSWVKLAAPHYTYCLCKSDVKEDYASRVFLYTEFPNDRRLKRYLECISMKLNLMEAATGAWNEKEFIRQVGGVTAKIIAMCNEDGKGEVDLPQKAYNMFLCIAVTLAVDEKWDRRQSDRKEFEGKICL
ncbi:hypothetical protein PPYR_11064 [Photinus pyralis]|uniref:Uncharacterized protein n=1 Tax=Photinus pyralis TaxID=7054 RepID=A0A5N4AI85_PHOPY|nr:uncharacterized protein LOC116173163 [Photinus pyralis]XP_031346342.1 uncharacterized protein LOC116173166 [Photinus pyralis]KAB0797003.1 hypothetical protein PPYR_11064 [Photinus pyralis]